MTLIYPGSFDPVTLGHIDIAARSAKIATCLIVAVLHNPAKQSLFSVKERTAFLQDAFGNINNIKVCSFDGMLVDFAAQHNATAILRGVRNIADFEAETNAAAYNKLLSSGGLETIFLPSNPNHTYISSSAVRELASFIYSNNRNDAPLSNMVTPVVQSALEQKFSRRTAVR